MSNKNLARRAAVGISFAGTDITKSIKPYLKAFTYTDNEADEADDIQIQLHDRDTIWMEKWLNEAIDAASAAKLKIDSVIVRENWRGDGKDAVLPCGECELDTVDYSLPRRSLPSRERPCPSAHRSGRPRRTRPGRTPRSRQSPTNSPGQTA